MKRTRDGLALLVTVGILMLLAVSGAALARLAFLLRETAGMTLDRTQARLLARCGVEYASARLSQDVLPRTPPTAENQTEDWTFRDGAGALLETARNPSYAQSEPYRDLDADGRYREGVDSYADANGNSRFDSWSGRLRDRHGMTGGTFVLKLLGESGKINLNGGWLDAGNRNGNYGNTVPDHRDVDEVRNRRYALVLDTLGKIVNVSSANGVDSRLGDLLKGRPYGGFQSMEQVRGNLLPADWEKVKDFLTVVETERARFSVADSAGGGFVNPGYYLGTEARPLVNLGVASKEVLKTLVNVSHSSPANSNNDGFFTYGDTPFENFLPVYARDQAARPVPVDDYLMGNRPFPSWCELYKSLVNVKNGWAVFGNLCADEVGGYYMVGAQAGDGSYYWFPPMSWQTYDVPPASASSAPRFRPMYKMGPLDDGANISIPIRPAGSSSRQPVCHVTATVLYVVYQGGTLEASLIPKEVSSFSMESLGAVRETGRGVRAARSASATLRVGTVISARTQEEFENRTDAGYSDHGQYRVVGRPWKDRTQSEPQFSIDSMEDYVQAYTQARPGKALYSPFWGTVRLADRSGYRRGERFYIPAWDVDQPLRPESATRRFAENFQDEAGAAAFTYRWGNGLGFGFVDPAFRGDRPMSYLFTAAPGVPPPARYDWSVDKFPLAKGGTVSQGAFEFWTNGLFVSSGYYPHAISLYVIGTGSPSIRVSRNESPTATFSASAGGVMHPSVLVVFVQDGLQGYVTSPILAGDWHHLVFAFNSASNPSMVGYLDGRPEPTLIDNSWDSVAMDPKNPPYLATGYPDEIRLYDKQLDQAEAMARALSSRYWTEERFPPAGWKPPIAERLKGVPSFTSPAYVFDHPLTTEGARWDGFVPNAIREAVDGWEAWALESGTKPGKSASAAPLRVELLCYPGTDPDGPYRVVPFPEGLWRSGGGWADFKAMWKSAYGAEPIPKFRGYRYRVWMDCSAIDGLNVETPVFDSISIAFRTGAKLLDARQE